MSDLVGNPEDWFSLDEAHAMETACFCHTTDVEYPRMIDTSCHSTDASDSIPEKMNAEVTVVLCSE